jgi:hypothetical protein
MDDEVIEEDERWGNGSIAVQGGYFAGLKRQRVLSFSQTYHKAIYLHFPESLSSVYPAPT